MIIIYRFLINLTLVFSPIIIFVRLLKKKEDLIRFKEKFTIFSIKRKKGTLIWFHGASVGEILSVIPLIRKLERKKNINQILLTSSTISSAKIFNQFKFSKTVHQFFPIDTTFFTNRFLSFWKPKLAIFIESEIWPNMLNNLKKKSINRVLLNSRITKKSFKRWKTLGKFSEDLFSSFNMTYPQNNETEIYLKKLKVKKIKKLGNLKFSNDPSYQNFKVKKNREKFLKKKKYWCAVSTHNGEELICANSHIELEKKIKNLVTIIIPRHVQRSLEIKNDLKEKGLKIHLHSDNSEIVDNTQIYIVDTYGETKYFFNKCNTVFLGKSLCGDGGQNPLEPARYNCNVLYGPNVSNFKEIYEFLRKKNIAYKVNEESQLTNMIFKIMSKKKSNDKKNGINLIGKNILKKSLSEIERLIKK